MSTLKDNLVFGIYEILTDVLPGSIIIGYLFVFNIIKENFE